MGEWKKRFMFFPLDVSSLPAWHYNFKGHFFVVTKIPKQEESCAQAEAKALDCYILKIFFT